MRGERFVALGLANVRSSWFRDLARWATSAALPLEFVKCVSTAELRARLASGRAFSAVIADGGILGVDRDLIELSRESGCAVVIVEDGRVQRDWIAVGAAAVLPQGFTRAELHDVLSTHAPLIGRGDELSLAESPLAPPGSWRGLLVAVTGAGGTGSSTIASALAQGMGADTRYAGLVLLADFALDADQAMLHDAGDVVPGVQELADAHRGGEPSAAEIRALTFAVPDRQYHLLLGLRRRRDWTAVRPRTFDASLDSLRRAYKAVIADISPDLEGEDQCGAIDVEERNVMARSTASAADLVVLVGLPGPKGMHSLVRLTADLIDHGINPGALLPVLNRAPRNPRARAELTRAFADLAGPFAAGRGTLAPLLHLGERRHLDEVVRDCAPLPSQMAGSLAAAASVVLERATRLHGGNSRLPVPVVAGSMGATYREGE